MTPSLKTRLYFSCKEFPDPKDGKYALLETPHSVYNPINMLFERAFKEASPFWHDSHHMGEYFDIDPLKKSAKFSYRLLSYDLSMARLQDADIKCHEYFWLSCSSEFKPLNAEAYGEGRKLHEVIFKLDTPLRMFFNEGAFVPSKVRPTFLIEVATCDNAMTSAIILQRLLHSSYQHQWIEHLPGNKDILIKMMKLIKLNQVKIVEILKEKKQILIPLDTTGNHYIFLHKPRHSVEGYLIYGKQAYGLTCFTNFKLEKTSSFPHYQLLKETMAQAPALFPVFQEAFTFNLNPSAAYSAFDVGNWQPLLSAIKDLEALKCRLPSKAIDAVVLNFLRTVSQLHSRGVQLDRISIDQMHLPINGTSYAANQKIALLGCSPLTDISKDLECLGLICYNMWIEYKSKSNCSLLLPEDLSAEKKAEIIAFLEDAMTRDYHPRDALRIAVIYDLLKGTQLLSDILIAFEVMYSNVYFKTQIVL
jgi:hypothetical protein